MKITIGRKPKIDTFGQLKNDQPFVLEEQLCIKINVDSYINLSDEEGNTWTAFVNGVDQFQVIDRALPMIKKWEY